nr:cytochrome P450 [Candidatus Dadabacteria bacterium]
MKSLLLPPGPKGLPILGSSFHYFKDILGFLTHMRQTYGEIAFFRLGKRNMYMVSDPEVVKDVLVTNNKNFSKSRALKRAKMVVGEGLLTSEAETHLKHRRMIQPVFLQSRISKYASVMSEHSVRISQKWQDGQIVDMHKEMMKLTFSIVVKTLFNSDIEKDPEEIGGALTDVMKQFTRLVFPFSEYLDKLPLPGVKKCNEALEKLDRTIYEFITERRGNEDNYDDLLSLLLSVRSEDDEDEGFSDQQIRDEAITLFIAGQETTANSLSWSLYLIAQHPEVENKLYEEISSVLCGSLPDMDDYKRLEYTKMVFTEAMRLYPPAWTVVRRALSDYVLKDYIVPKGDDIFMSQYVIHRDPRFYTDPLQFRPERWENDYMKSIPKFAYYPFGGGPRLCIGEGFAWMEGVLVLATILSNWKMRLVENKPV